MQAMPIVTIAASACVVVAAVWLLLLRRRRSRDDDRAGDREAHWFGGPGYKPPGDEPK